MQCVEIKDPATGDTAKILVSLGFNCFSWRVVFGDGPRDLLWAEPGFEAGDKRPSGSGIPLLFPFPGRIGGGEFTWEGRKFLLPCDPDRRHAIHGFVFNRPWRLVEQTGDSVTAEFQASIDDPAILNHWPSDFRIRASYRLHDRQLLFDAEWQNTGYDTLPWGFGTHAYFRLPLRDQSAASDSILSAPVDGEWTLEDMLTTGELVPLPADLDLATGQRLGDLQFDSPYRLTSSGRTATRVGEPSGHRGVLQSFDAGDFPHVVIYTPGDRQSVCLEPYSCLPDPFRLEAEGVSTGLRTLAPGELHRTQVVLKAEGE